MRGSVALISAVLLAGLTQLTLACGESKRSMVPVGSSGAGSGGQGASSGATSATGGAGAQAGTGEGGAGAAQVAVGGDTNAASGGAGGRGVAAGAGGTLGHGAVGGDSGSGNSGAGGADVGSAGDGAAGAGPLTGFAADFIPRAQAALKAAAPPWTCATTLPAVPVADGEAVREVVRAFIAEAMDVAPADITMTTEECGAPTRASCAEMFAHDTASSGGAIYDTTSPLAQELDANATNVEVSTWVPMKDGLSLSAVFVITGISDGVLVGMAVFNTPDVCN